MLYLLLKSLHIIGFTAWFSGLFYLGRIFVYHKEKLEENKDGSEYHLMEVRAYKIICNPAMMITWTCGLAMLAMNGLEWLQANPWMYPKLILLILLTIHHVSRKKTIAQLKADVSGIDSYRFRLLNEVPTMFLFAIVLLAVFKNGLNTLYAFVGLVLLGAILMAATKWYKKGRESGRWS